MNNTNTATHNKPSVKANEINLSAIFACDPNGVIGNDGQLPWQNLPGDLACFKEITKDATLIMGRKTFDSLPGQLPGRPHWVLSKSVERTDPHRLESKPLVYFNDMDKLVYELVIAKLLEPNKKFFVIGGAELLGQMLPLISTIYLTRTVNEYIGDAVLPSFKENGDYTRLFKPTAQTDLVFNEDGSESHYYETLTTLNPESTMTPANN